MDWVLKWGERSSRNERKRKRKLRDSAPSRQNRSWSDLPAELLDLILKRMAGEIEFVLFGCVCKSWRSVAAACSKDHKQQFMANKHPYIIFISPSRPTDLFLFSMSISDRRMYKRTLPSNLVGKTFVGSSCGYLLLKDPQHCRHSQLWLLNPFTGHEVHIPSPRNRHCSRFILANPPNKNKFVVIALSEVFPFLQLYRYGCSSTAGDDHGRPHDWIVVKNNSEGNLVVTWIVDAVVFKGKVYILTGDGMIGILNIQLDLEDYDGMSDHISDADHHHHKGIEIHIEMLRLPGLTYAHSLVASDEQLFMVHYDDQTLKGIYRLDFSRMDWAELNSFGKDEALFLGHTKFKYNCGFVSKIKNLIPSDSITSTSFCLYYLSSTAELLKLHSINGEQQVVKVRPYVLKGTSFWYFPHQAFCAD